MCDLMRTQIYFIMRFNLYNSEFQKLVSLKDISEHLGAHCILVQTLQIFSSFSFTSNMLFNTQSQLQFQGLLPLLIEQKRSAGNATTARGVFATVDQCYFLRVWYFLFILTGPRLDTCDNDE